MSNPRLGGVFDEQTKQLRLVEGIPGAANLGGFIPTGSPVEQAWIVPQSKRALVVFSGDQPGLAVVDWNNQVQVLRAGIRFEDAAVAAISPLGKTFAVVADNGIESWSISSIGLKRLWRVEGISNPISLAISDDGELVAALLPGRLAIVQPSGYAATLAETESSAAMGFAHNSHVFAFGLEGGNSAQVYDGLPSLSNVEIQWDSSEAERLVGLGFSGDNRLLAMAWTTENGGRARLFNAAEGRTIAALETQSSPNGIFRANGNAVFQLTTSAKATSKLLDADADEARLVVIAGQEISNE